jgi:hypothetical protein
MRHARYELWLSRVVMVMEYVDPERSRGCEYDDFGNTVQYRFVSGVELWSSGNFRPSKLECWGGQARALTPTFSAPREHPSNRSSITVYEIFPKARPHPERRAF